MYMNQDIENYNKAQTDTNQEICNKLYAEINKNIQNAENKIWHGAPVWFLEGNPIVGYWVRKNGVQLLFWSGQSFDEPALKAEGKFKAAEMHYTSAAQINTNDLKRWLEKAVKIQWDYKNIVKLKGVLERIKHS